jgi:hypothetical protein
LSICLFCQTKGTSVMAKVALLNVLKRTLGTYVDGLDAESLHVSIRKGSVDLSNLTLKHEAIESLQLPVRVTRGHLGKVCVKVPWSHLGSQSVTISIQDVFLQLAPRESTDWGAMEKAASAAKLEKLEIKELLRQQQASFKNSIIAEESGQEEKGTSWSKKMAVMIAENIQVEIKNVHIRYEDFTLPKNPVALGITICSVIVATTNQQGEKVFMADRADSLLYKVLSVCGAAVYCDPEPQQQAGLADAEWVQQMRSFVSEKQSKQHLISPATWHIHLAKDDNPAASPNCKIETRLGNLACSISSRQYQRLVGFARRMSPPQLDRASRYAKYRPQTSITQDPKVWWKYAAKACTIAWPAVNWHSVLRAARERREYINLFKRSQEVAWLEALSDQETDRMRELEQSHAAHCSVARLLLYRSLAEAELGVEFGKKRAADAGKGRRRSTLRFMQKRPQKLQDMVDVTLTVEEHSELHAAVGGVVLLPSAGGSDVEGDPDIVTYRVSLELPCCSFELKDDASQPMLSLHTCGCYCVQLTSMQGAFTVEGSFSVFQVRDCCTPGTLFPLLLDTTSATTATVPDSMDVMARADRCTFVNPSLKQAQLKRDEGVMWFHVLVYPSASKERATSSTDPTLASAEGALRHVGSERATMVTDVRARMGGFELAIQPDADALLSQLQEAFSISEPVEPVLHEPRDHAYSAVKNQASEWAQKREEQLTEYAFSQQDSTPKIRCTFFAKAPRVAIIEDCTDSDSTVLVADFGSLSFVDAESPHDNATCPLGADRWWFQTSEIQLMAGKVSQLLAGSDTDGCDVFDSPAADAPDDVPSRGADSPVEGLPASHLVAAEPEMPAAFRNAALLRKQHPEQLVGKRIFVEDVGKVCD